jgi:hypothetical protein
MGQRGECLARLTRWSLEEAETEQIGIMSEEKEATSSKPAEKSGIRVAQIIAAALAAVTAALLGSTLGVAGTVMGAGVASIVTTVGGEVYLRSLQRTREAALRAKVAAARALTVPGARLGRVQQAVDTLPLAEQPTVQLPRPGVEPPPGDEGAVSTLRKLRWPLIIGTSAVAFVLAFVALFAFNTAGANIKGIPSGGFSGNRAPASTPKDTPSTGESTPSSTDTPTSSPTTSSSPTTTTTSPTTTPTSPSTTPTSPTTSKSSSTPSSTPSAPPSDGAAHPT